MYSTGVAFSSDGRRLNRIKLALQEASNADFGRVFLFKGHQLSPPPPRSTAHASAVNRFSSQRVWCGYNCATRIIVKTGSQIKGALELDIR
jgi:hypothetical protein